MKKNKIIKDYILKKEIMKIMKKIIIMNMEHISNIKNYIINYMKLPKKEIKKKRIQIKKINYIKIIMY